MADTEDRAEAELVATNQVVGAVVGAAHALELRRELGNFYEETTLDSMGEPYLAQLSTEQDRDEDAARTQTCLDDLPPDMV